MRVPGVLRPGAKRHYPRIRSRTLLAPAVREVCPRAGDRGQLSRIEEAIRLSAPEPLGGSGGSSARPALWSILNGECCVIPKIRRADSDYFGRPRSAFCRTGSARALELWIDPRVRDHPDAQLLARLAEHDGLDIYSTFEAPGMQVVETIAHAASDTAAASWIDDSGRCTQRGGLLSVQLGAAERLARRLDVEAGSLLETAILASVAGARSADVFVTDADGVEVLSAGTNATSIADALSLVGLFMRNLDEYIAAGEPTVRYDRSAFWWLMSRELLPAWGPTWRDMGDRADDGQFPHTNGLGFATLERVGQALRARDSVHGELQGQPRGGSGEEAAQAFDVLVLCLDAAFDAGARVVNSHRGLGRDSAARWRSKNFTKKLIAVAPAFEPLVKLGGSIGDAIGLLGALRRTIHAAPMQAIGYDSSDERHGTRMAVTVETLNEIEPVLSARGGGTKWGVDASLDDMPLVDMHTFTEELSALAIDALDAMIRAAVGRVAPADKIGDWGDTLDIRRQMRLLTGTEHWRSRLGAMCADA